MALRVEDASGFDWDAGNRDKCEQHGVTIREVEAIFRELILIVDDPDHSVTEPRLRAIGRAREGRHVFAAFTLREQEGRTLVRPISARYMHRKEIDRYEWQAPPRPEQR